jgi:hypothetical protein
MAAVRQDRVWNKDCLVAAVVRTEQKSRYHRAGIKGDEIQAMTKEKLACPVWTPEQWSKSSDAGVERGGSVVVG